MEGQDPRTGKRALQESAQALQTGPGQSQSAML